MAFDIGQIIQQQFESNQNRISQLEQQQAKPQGGILSQIDPAWLALAQGFLAPTRTGGFGESLANAAGQLQGPLAQMKQQQLSAQEKIEKLKESQAKLAMDWYKAQKGGSDDGLDIYRELRNEKMIEGLYRPDFKKIDDEIKKYNAIVADNFNATDEQKAEAKAALDRLRSEREALDAKVDAAKARRGIQGRERAGTSTPPSQAQPQAQEQDIKNHPEVKEAVRLYNENKGRINPADLPLKKKQIVDRLNQHGIKADESIFAD